MKNILISGWPGAGVTTITCLLSYTLNMKFLRGTESFRYIWKKLVSTETGSAVAEVEKIVQPYYGKIFDEYIDHVLSTPTNLIVETDIGGFRLGKRESYISVFVVADEKTRGERLGSDGRPEDRKIREESLVQEYEKLHGFNWFDLKAIKEKYNFILDNSKLSISEEMLEIFKFIKESSLIDDETYNNLINNIKEIEKLYWEEGKDWFINNLNSKNLIIPAEQTIREIRKIFEKEITKFPSELKQIILEV